jgi:hypothetical protein
VRTLKRAWRKYFSDFPQIQIYFVHHRKTANTYWPKIGIDAHWARDMTFLAEDLAQITTFESKEQMLIKAMESIS